MAEKLPNTVSSSWLQSTTEWSWPEYLKLPGWSLILAPSFEHGCLCVWSLFCGYYCVVLWLWLTKTGEWLKCASLKCKNSDKNSSPTRARQSIRSEQDSRICWDQSFCKCYVMMSPKQLKGKVWTETGLNSWRRETQALCLQCKLHSRICQKLHATVRDTKDDYLDINLCFSWTKHKISCNIAQQ
jgi:hypothetical protein